MYRGVWARKFHQRTPQMSIPAGLVSWAGSQMNPPIFCTGDIDLAARVLWVSEEKGLRSPTVSYVDFHLIPLFSIQQQSLCFLYLPSHVSRLQVWSLLGTEPPSLCEVELGWSCGWAEDQGVWFHIHTFNTPYLLRFLMPSICKPF